MVPWSILSHGHTTFNFNFLIWVLFVLGNFLWTIYRRWEFGVYWEEGILPCSHLNQIGHAGFVANNTGD